MRVVCLLLLCTGLGFAAAANAAASSETPGADTVPTTTQPIRIDGRLDEPAWQHALVRHLPYQFQPGGIPQAPVRTRVLLLSDRDNLYIAYHAFDPHPADIRAHLDDRDQALHDDYVGMMLDTFHDRRRAYEFLANPLGVQIDAFRNEVTGNEDATFDAIWNSAGRIVDDGYIVEIAIPFRQLRFADTSQRKTWGLFLFRNYPRDVRHQLADIPVDINRDCLVCQERIIVGMANASPGHDLQVTPTLTATRADSRPARGAAFQNTERKVDTGLDVRWGITPNNTLSATFNPDFSTVELDIPQLQINNQFALFYPERRPFFLNDAAHFDMPMDVVYTRTIADPDWGVKLTGRSGANSYGVFTASDNFTTLVYPDPERSSVGAYDRPSQDAVARYQRDFDENNAVGVIATQRSGDGYHNRVVGLDGRIMFNDTDQLIAQYLHSDTRYADFMIDATTAPVGNFTDDAYRFVLKRDAKHYDLHANYDRLGRGFRADLGYINQVGVDRLGVGGGYKWFGAKNDWFTQHGFDAEWDLNHLEAGQVLDRRVKADYFVKAGWQTNFKLSATKAETLFNGQIFRYRFVTLHGEAQPTNGLFMGLDVQTGGGIDFENTRRGQLRRISPMLTWQAGSHLRTEVQGVFENFNAPAGHVYAARLIDLRLYYQFNLRTQLRLITQYSDLHRNLDLYTDPTQRARRQRWGNQLLFSYKVNPRTVVYAGYADNYIDDPQNTAVFLQHRLLFLKLSYAWQL